jgi:hypothetical protein
MTLTAAQFVAMAAANAYTPIEDFGWYEPQETCTPEAKPGTLALARFLMRQYPGTGSSGISRSCASGGTSEHKEGRAFDWRVDASSERQKRQAHDFLDRLFASDRRGEPDALARRMGIMYVIFDDKIYGSYRGFEPADYLHSACNKLATCSRTYRHKDHMHISLTRAGGWGQSSWYRQRGVKALPVLVPFSNRLDEESTAYFPMTVTTGGRSVTTPFKLVRGTPYTLLVQGLYRTGPGSQVADAGCAYDRATGLWLPILDEQGFGLFANGERLSTVACTSSHDLVVSYQPKKSDALTLRFVDSSPEDNEGALRVHLIRPELLGEVAVPLRRVINPEPTPWTNPGAEGPRLTEETVSLPAQLDRGRLTEAALRAGQKYVVTVRGTATDGDSAFDGECVSWSGRWRYTHTQNLLAPTADHLDVYLDGIDLDLRPAGEPIGTCDRAEHTYRTVFTAPVNGRARLAVWDPNSYDDNAGALEVTIRRLN